ncbi:MULTISPECIES: hypothetical protein [unclassified Streptomyces]|uniref:hypothetical protein n=1 Tax=unclassified Streptomyces TaxID=2593676 RepID=UPI0033A56463
MSTSRTVSMGTEAFSFAAEATAGSTAGFHRIAVPGANHHYFTTRWSPRSGEVAAADDAGHDEARPGQCTEPGGSTYEPQLTETAQRRIGAAHSEAFFRRYLIGDEAADGLLTDG